MHLSTRMNRRLHCSLSAIVLVGLSSAAAAQNAAGSAASVTLAQAIERAQQSSESVAMARAGAQRARAEARQAQSGRYPQLSLSLGYTRTLESEYSDVFSGDSAGPFTGLSLPFGQANRYEMGVTASHTVYSGGRVRSRTEAANAAVRSADVGIGVAGAELTLNVTAAYYDALLADRFVAIAEATLAQAEATLAQVNAGGRAGVKPEFDVVRARVARDQQEPVVITRRSDRDLAYMRLKQLMGEELDAVIALATPLLDACPAEDHDAADSRATADTAASTRAVVLQAAAAVDANEHMLDAVKAQRRPTIALQTQYGRVGYPRSAVPDNGDMRTNWTAGVSVQLPLFTGGRIAGEAMAAAADLAESRERLQQVREAAALDGRRALERLNSAEAVLEASGATVMQAERAYAIAEVRFAEGLSTQVELSDARLVLEQARMSRAQAARDVEVARTVVRLLPALPIGSGS